MGWVVGVDGWVSGGGWVEAGSLKQQVLKSNPNLRDRRRFRFNVQSNVYNCTSDSMELFLRQQQKIYMDTMATEKYKMRYMA